MLFLFEILAMISAAYVLWFISGFILELAHNLCFKSFGNHFF